MRFLICSGISRFATLLVALPTFFGCGPSFRPREPPAAATTSSEPIDTPAAILLAEQQFSDITADVEHLQHVRDDYSSAVDGYRRQVDELATEINNLQADIVALHGQRRDLATEVQSSTRELQSIHREIAIQEAHADRLQSQNLDFLERQLQIAHQRIEALQQPAAATPRNVPSQPNFENDRARQTRSNDIAESKVLLRAHIQDSFATYEPIEFSYYDATILRSTRRAIAYGNCTSFSFSVDQLDIVLFAQIYPDPVSRRAYYRVRVRCL